MERFTSCGSGRAGSRPRCPRCALHLPLCICAGIEPLDLRTRVVVIAHQAEVKKPTNTGRLVPLTLTRGELRVRGRRGEPLDASDLVGPDQRTLLLYPTPDARPLSELVAEDGAPITLVVPDGNWRQARKVASREPDLRAVPRAVLPPGPPSRYRLRAHPNPDYVSTFEAVARALGIIEGPHVQSQLEEVLERMVARTLWTRGELGPGVDPTTL